jgi:hypothetical protein
MVLLKPCKTTAAFEAIPQDDQALDLDALERTLADAGWMPVANARVMLIVAKTVEATIFQSGKLLIKTMDRAQAQRTLDELWPHLGVPEAAYGS